MALSADTNIDRLVDEQLGQLPVAASATIYKGSLVGASAGYARALTAGDMFLGLAYAGADNSSGSAGDINVKLFRGGRFDMTLTGVAVTDVGKPVFASDDGTLTLTFGGANSFVGYVTRYVSSNKATILLLPAVEVRDRVRSQLNSSASAASFTPLIIPKFALTVLGVDTLWKTSPIASTGGNVYLNVGWDLSADDPDDICDDQDQNGLTAEVVQAMTLTTAAGVAVASGADLWAKVGQAATAGVGGLIQLEIRYFQPRQP